jgi:(p)ppGpp synthase/HD superfamily hydrolase
MLVIKAIEFAAIKHKGQERRGSGLPYVTHPIIVMELIQKYKGDSTDIEALKCAALLHDVLEDTDCTYAELEREFNPLVASLVMELTSDPVAIKEIGKKEYIKNKMAEMTKYAFILKLLDRYSNIIDGPTEKYVKTTLETMDFLKENRQNITDRQFRIIGDIETACHKFLEDKEK